MHDVALGSWIACECSLGLLPGWVVGCSSSVYSSHSNIVMSLSLSPQGSNMEGSQREPVAEGCSKVLTLSLPRGPSAFLAPGL